MQVATATSKRIKPLDGKSKGGLQWDVPLMLSKCKEGSDRNRIQCMVFDFVVHPDTCRMALNNARFKVLQKLQLALSCSCLQCHNLALLGLDPTEAVLHTYMHAQGTGTVSFIQQQPQCIETVKRVLQCFHSPLVWPYSLCFLVLQAESLL